MVLQGIAGPRVNVSMLPPGQVLGPFNKVTAGPVEKLVHKVVTQVRISRAVNTLFNRYADDVMEPLPQRDGLDRRLFRFAVWKKFKNAVMFVVKDRFEKKHNGNEKLTYKIFKAHRPVPMIHSGSPNN